jgi:hypothetical protein
MALSASVDDDWGMDDERALCAVHEAGHVIVALLVGVRVAGAEIGDAYRRGLQARTEFAGNWRRPAPWGRLAITLAGPLAEATYTGRDVLAVLNDGRDFEASDLCCAQREARRLARLRHFQNADHALLVAEWHAQRLLTAHWDFVMRAARQMYTVGRIE